METSVFVAYYTHQKVKKHKNWQEGTIKMNAQGNKVLLYDEGGALIDRLLPFTTASISLS